CFHHRSAFWQHAYGLVGSAQRAGGKLAIAVAKPKLVGKGKLQLGEIFAHLVEAQRFLAKASRRRTWRQFIDPAVLAMLASGVADVHIVIELEELRMGAPHVV